MVNIMSGDSAITVQDVAARAGVSAMTVSRVINAPARVAPDTRQRVEQAIRDLGFVPNALARGLLHGRTHTVALLVGDISNPFFMAVARGVEDVAQRNGYTVFFGNSDESADKEHHYVQAMLSRRTDGLLIVPASDGSRQTLQLLNRRQLPFVQLDRALDGIASDAVVGDNIGGSRLLVEHLIGLGHRKIGLVNGASDVSTARERRRGYLEALKAYGIEPQPDWIFTGDFRREGGQRAAHHWLALPIEQRPTAIFADNNFHAIGLIEALREARIRVPEDVALVSFDDLELASALYPFLTVVAQPARTFGTIAMQFLLERFTSSEPLPPRKVVLPPELIVRVSCGAQLRR